jgi:formate dehydrogenase subunit delta
MSPDRLAYMANQIGKFFAHQPHDQAVGAIENHLRKFWDKRMRVGILAAIDHNEAQLDPTVREAIERLRTPAAA